MMGNDEEEAISLLAANRKIHQNALAKYEGKFIKEIGDGVLATFDSSLAAVYCAQEIQLAAQQIPSLQIRIGIHAGDIIFKDGDVFGDSVNIASRIESIGEPGSILISERVQRDIDNRAKIKTAFIGIKHLKNLKDPLGIYSIVQEGGSISGPYRGGRTMKNSIAVLPFTNMSPYSEQEYFCDGLAEELINALTQIDNLNVVARTSSFVFKNSQVDIQEIGRRLNVGIVVEGSIQKSGNRIRITIQLIKVDDGYHIWSERYDRDLTDIFEIQDEITGEIVNRLRSTLQLSPPRRHNLRPENLAAYDSYLKGRFCINKLAPEAIELAIDHYAKAIEHDHTFGLVYASLAEAYTLLSTGFDIRPAKDAMPKARKAAFKALEFNPALPEAYVSLGQVAMFYDWNRQSTRDYFNKALALDPDSIAAHQWIEFYWSFMEGDFDKAMAAVEAAQRLDPLNLMIQVRKGYIYVYQRDFDKAVDYFEDLTGRIPEFSLAYHCLMDTYGRLSRYDDALKAGKKMLELGGNAVANLGVLGFHYGLAGQKSKGREIQSELIRRSKEGYVSSFWVASISYGLGEMDETFHWLDQAFNERDGNLLYLTTPPQFDNLRLDPRFDELMQKMGLEHLVKK